LERGYQQLPQSSMPVKQYALLWDTPQAAASISMRVFLLIICLAICQEVLK
jgi:hypothetical protein